MCVFSSIHLQRDFISYLAAFRSYYLVCKPVTLHFWAPFNGQRCSPQNRHRCRSMKQQVEVKSMNHRPGADCALCCRRFSRGLNEFCLQFLAVIWQLRVFWRTALHHSVRRILFIRRLIAPQMIWFQNFRFIQLTIFWQSVTALGAKIDWNSAFWRGCAEISGRRGRPKPSIFCTFRHAIVN